MFTGRCLAVNCLQVLYCTCLERYPYGTVHLAQLERIASIRLWACEVIVAHYSETCYDWLWSNVSKTKQKPTKWKRVDLDISMNLKICVLPLMPTLEIFPYISAENDLDLIRVSVSFLWYRSNTVNLNTITCLIQYFDFVTNFSPLTQC